MPTDEFITFAREQWIPALRSGQYRRASGMLYDPDVDGYCCLGVLCEIHPDVARTDDNAYEYREDSNYTILPADLALHFGIHQAGDLRPITAEGRHILGITISHTNCLASLNDSGKTFDEIADIIELALEGEHIAFS